MTKAFALGRAAESKGIKDTREPAGYSDKDDSKCEIRWLIVSSSTLYSRSHVKDSDLTDESHDGTVGSSPFRVHEPRLVHVYTYRVACGPSQITKASKVTGPNLGNRRAFGLAVYSYRIHLLLNGTME